jgi:hypothetical protein
MKIESKQVAVRTLAWNELEAGEVYRVEGTEDGDTRYVLATDESRSVRLDTGLLYDTGMAARRRYSRVKAKLVIE